MPTLKEKNDALAKLRADHQKRFEAFDAETDSGRKSAILQEINRAEVDIKSLSDEVAQEVQVVEMKRRNEAEMKGLRLPAGVGVPFPERGGKDGELHGERMSAIKSVGQSLIDDKSDIMHKFREYNEKYDVVYEYPFRSVGEWKAAIQAEMKTTLTESGFTAYDRLPNIITLGAQVPMVRDLIPQGQTTAITIRYPREVSYTNGATNVAEGGQKPEAVFNLAEVDAPVRKIAVVARVTDEMFADFPAVRDYINMRLPFMVEQQEDNQILNGNGSSPNLQGILGTTGVLSGGALNQSASPADDPIVNVILRAITRIQAESFFQPTGIVINPFDWENVRLMRSGTGDAAGGANRGLYLFGNPDGMGIDSIWGLPVVKTVYCPRGKVLVGAFSLGAQIFRREGITMQMSNSDGNDFSYNRVALRVEERLALAVYRPSAFGVCTLHSYGEASSSA